MATTMRPVLPLLCGLLLWSLVACPPPPASKHDAGASDAAVTVDAALAYTPIDAALRADLAASLATAVSFKRQTIPERLLSADDLENENNFYDELYDAQEALVGYARDIFTPVYCTGGACQAIHFVLVFDPQLGFLDVFHPTGTSHDFMKYWQDSYDPFTEADLDKLRDVLRHPPQVLLDTEDYADLVIGASETAPTREQYQDVVVRGAAFTVYQVLNYMLETKAILEELN